MVVASKRRCLRNSWDQGKTRCNMVIRKGTAYIAETTIVTRVSDATCHTCIEDWYKARQVNRQKEDRRRLVREGAVQGRLDGVRAPRLPYID